MGMSVIRKERLAEERRIKRDERRRQYQKKKRAANKEESIQRERLYSRRSRFLTKLRSLRIVGGEQTPRCTCCQTVDIRVLTINHKNHGGRIEDSKAPRRGNNLIYNRIVRCERATEDLEVRCYNCNILYEYERGRCALPDNWEELVGR